MSEANKLELTIGSTGKRSRFTPLAVSLDWDALPDASQRFVIMYGLRKYLQDARAGIEDEKEAREASLARVEKLKSGDLSRTKGEAREKPDTVESRALKLASAFIREELKKVEAKAEASAIREAAQELVRDEPKWKAEAKKQLDAEAGLKEPNEAGKAVIASLLAKIGGNK